MILLCVVDASHLALCLCSVFGMSFGESSIVGKLSRAWYCRSGFGSDLPLLGQQLSTRARISLPIPLTVPVDKRFLGQSNLILASQFLPVSPLIQSPAPNCVYPLSMRAAWWTDLTFFLQSAFLILSFIVFFFSLSVSLTLSLLISVRLLSLIILRWYMLLFLSILNKNNEKAYLTAQRCSAVLFMTICFGWVVTVIQHVCLRQHERSMLPCSLLSPILHLCLGVLLSGPPVCCRTQPFALETVIYQTPNR